MLSRNTVTVIEVCAGLWEALQAAPPERLPVLGRFRRALNLAWHDDVLALVTPDLGAGPFHLVIAGWPPEAASYRVEAVSATQLVLDAFVLDFTHARRWFPRPDWAQFSPQPRHWAALLEAGSHHPLPAYLLAPLADLKQALRALDDSALAEAARALAGLGPGLTPAGDDVLAGAMLRLHSLGHADLTQPIYSAAAQRTTRLSRAFLAAARDGLVNAAWMELLQALAAGTPSALERALRRVLAFGATSGADMLHGFLAA